MISIHISPNNLTHSTRILKETLTISQLNLFSEIYLVGTWQEGLKKEEKIDEVRSIKRFKTIYGSFPQLIFLKPFRYFEFVLKVFIYFLSKKEIKYIHAHNLGVLPLSFFLKIIKNSKLIYDTHELATEVTGMTSVRKKIAKLVERTFIKRADAVIVVSESIAEWYRKTYNLNNVYLLRNIPDKTQTDIDTLSANENILRKKFNINPNEILFIYQGLINKDRGSDILLDVFSKVNRNKHIVFMGNGLLENTVKDYSSKYINIHYLPSVPPSEILLYTRCADIGIHAIINNCINHDYCLPNKLFEYIFAETPVLVTGLKEMKQFIAKYNIGMTFQDSEELIQKINQINFNTISQYKVNTKIAKKAISWEQDALFLKDIIK